MNIEHCTAQLWLSRVLGRSLLEILQLWPMMVPMKPTHNPVKLGKSNVFFIFILLVLWYFFRGMTAALVLQQNAAFWRKLFILSPFQMSMQFGLDAMAGAGAGAHHGLGVHGLGDPGAKLGGVQHFADRYSGLQWAVSPASTSLEPPPTQHAADITWSKTDAKCDSNHPRVSRDSTDFK